LINTTENNDNRGRHFELSYVFVILEVCVHWYMSQNQPRFNHEHVIHWCQHWAPIRIVCI